MKKHIGTLKGKVLVFGGVYSNMQALEAIIQVAEQHDIAPKNIICTGDIVGYCAEPEAALQTVKNWGIHTILGNVEIQLRDKEEDCGCNFNEDSRCDIFSRQWYPYAQQNVSENSLKWLKTLPDHLTFEYANQKGIVVHGTFFETSGYMFKSTNWSEKERNFKAADANLILGGHCGLPFSDVKNGQYWLNAGVIGMPANDGTTNVWYMIMNDESNFTYEHQPLKYNYQQAHDLMQRHNLPPQYAKTLLTGLWDNCEILPVEETALQGQEIVVIS